jgi:reactive chlorine resistance protein C
VSLCRQVALIDGPRGTSFVCNNGAGSGTHPHSLGSLARIELAPARGALRRARHCIRLSSVQEMSMRENTTESLTPAHHDAPILGVFTPTATRRLMAAGRGVLRYGLVALLLMWGGMKFAEFEAKAIEPLLAHHPLMSWMVPALGLRGASAVIGIVELAAVVLICLRRIRPALSALGSLIAAGTFVVTLSFLVTTPGILALDNPFGGFVMKDLILLGAALYTAAEALEAAAARRR